MTDKSFVHLNIHSEYSLKDSIVKVNDLVSKTKEMGMHSVAISDVNNMYAAIKQYKKSMSSGIKPIISTEITVSNGSQLGQLNLIAQNDEGYRNLCEIITRSYEEGLVPGGDTPVVNVDWLKDNSKGIIALSSGRKGLIGKYLIADRPTEANEEAIRMKEIYGDMFYIELQRIGHPDDDKYVHSAVNSAVELDIPVVATNPVTFIERNEYKTHEVRAAISRKTSVSQMREHDPYAYTEEQYLKSPDEMHELFHDIPSALENSVQIARKCNINITLGEFALPDFPVPEGMTQEEFLESESYIGLDKRLEVLFDVNSPDFPEIQKEYKERLAFELNVVNKMGFPGYFLIVADFIQWSKDNDIPVGPGRGSGAGSLIAYALKITDLDPLEYDLLFERFLNPERVSMPDFDVDFCMDRREEVIKYVSMKYGENSVAQIVTYGTMAAKSVVRDVARCLGFPYAVGNKISNMIPSKPGTKLKDAIEENSELQLEIDTNSEVRLVIEHSLKLEGISRHTGKHAGGVCIAPGNTSDFSPTQNEVSKTGEIINKVTQFDKNDVEDAGLVKFDFLGLKTLTIIHNAVKNANVKLVAQGKEPIDIARIPLDDKDVFDLFTRGDTTAVFQVESKGMKDLLTRMKPDCFEDIIALVALYRPGPLESGMVDNFINRKHGREEISYPDSKYQHESLKEILEPTYGVILYQEQVMQIAQVLAGYSLGQADMLRRAMGKKKPEEMAKQRAGFEQGAIDNGIDGQLAIKIFDLVEKFAGYGFNKSHSAAYALVAYQTAWMKYHFGPEFMAAVLSGDMDNVDKIVTYVSECRAMGISLLPPDLNKSKEQFSPTFNNEIIYGMGAVKGVGETAIGKILVERENNGEYKSLYDYCMRVGANKTTIEASIRSGLLDNMGPSRSSLMETYPTAIKVGRQASKIEKDSPQMGMFGSIMDDVEIVKFAETPEWDELHRLAGERKTLGLYLTGHPLTTYEAELENVISGKLADLIGSDMEGGNEETIATDSEEESNHVKWEDKNVTVAGLIMEMEIKDNKNGQTAFITLDDKSRQVDVMIFNKTLHGCQHALQLDKTVIIEGKLKMDKRTKRIRLFAFNVKSVDMIRELNATGIMLNFNTKNFNPEMAEKLKELIAEQPYGQAAINAHYKTDQHDRKMQLGDSTVKISDEFINKLKEMFGNNCVQVEYKQQKQNLGVAAKEAQEADRKIKLEEGQRTRESRQTLMASALDEARSSMGM